MDGLWIMGEDILETTIVTDLFSVLDQAALIIMKKHKISYLEGLCAAGEDIFKDRVTDHDLKEKLEPLYAAFFHKGMTAEDVRRAFQLAVLKGMKKDSAAGDDMTPDALVILMGHIASQLMGKYSSFSVLDPAAGTANLLTGIMNQSSQGHILACGADTNDLMIRLAWTNANLQQNEIHLLHQDGLKPILTEPADLVVCDVPVGFYPDQENAKQFELNGTDGKAYTHFLFIEQGLKQLKAGGYLLYLIPNRLFSDDHDHHFHRFMQKHAIVLALLQLPLTLFRKPEAAKSIMLLRKKGGSAAVPGETLLAELPDFLNENAMRKVLQRIDQWFTDQSV